MKEGPRSLLFLLVMALIVGNVLAAISLGLREGIERNRKMLQIRSLLSVLQVPDTEGKSDAELLALYEQKVVERPGDPAVYEYREGGRTVAYAFDIGGRGLWDRIKGYLAVEADGRTVRAIRFYEQKETAGLGGEIGTADFERRFVGKELKATEQYLRIVKAGTVSQLGPTQVDGITGATLTGDAINVFLQHDIDAFLARKEQL